MKTTVKTKTTLAATLMLSIGLVACQAPLTQESSYEAVVDSTGPMGSAAPDRNAVPADDIPIADEISPASENEPVSVPAQQPVSMQRTIALGSSNELVGPQAQAELQSMFEELSKWRSVTRLRIVGHTDSEGSELSNQKLSTKRAEAVAQRLAEFGLVADVLELEGKGELVPLGDNSTVAGRAANRRVEIEVEGIQVSADVPQDSQWAQSEL